jgi:hypothetical protein
MAVKPPRKKKFAVNAKLYISVPKVGATRKRYAGKISAHYIFADRAVLHGPTALGLLLFQVSNYCGLNRPSSMFTQHDFFNDPSIGAVCAKDWLVQFPTTDFAIIEFARVLPQRSVLPSATTRTRHPCIHDTIQRSRHAGEVPCKPPSAAKHPTKKFVCPSQRLGEFFHGKLFQRGLTVAQTRRERPRPAFCSVLLIVKK